MHDQSKRRKDFSTSLLFMPFAPIGEITEENAKHVVEWLDDRSKMLTWFTSLITGSLILLTIFGRKPGVEDINTIMLSVSLLLMFASILCNLICVWQIPKWKFAIRMGQVSNGRKMTLDLEITAWVSIMLYLTGLVCSAIGNCF
jgi:hypothetical protein